MGLHYHRTKIFLRLPWELRFMTVTRATRLAHDEQHSRPTVQIESGTCLHTGVYSMTWVVPSFFFFFFFKNTRSCNTKPALSCS